MSERSIGMIETWGYAAAVEALDAGMKAANVFSEGCKVTPSALVTVSFTGDVSAVKTAVDAGIAAARKVGEIVAHHVIPRPDAQLRLKTPDPDRSVTSPQAKKAKTKQVSSSASRPKKKKVEAETGPVSEVVLLGASGPKVRHAKSSKTKASSSKSRDKQSTAKPISSPKKTARRKPKIKPQGGDKKSGA